LNILKLRIPNPSAENGEQNLSPTNKVIFKFFTNPSP